MSEALASIPADLTFWPGPLHPHPKLELLPERRIRASDVESLVAFISRHARALEPIGLRGLVVGLSGGIDSAVTLALSARALGRSSVLAVTVDLGLPGHAQQVEQARRLAAQLGVEHRVCDARVALAALTPESGFQGPFSQINLITRIIQMMVFGVADEREMGVVSTVDRSEALLGRHTECFYGHIAPLGQLYKTEVAQVGEHLGLDRSVLDQAPGCLEAWLDEDVLGAPYSVIDPLLRLLVDEGGSLEEISRRHAVDAAWLQRLWHRVEHQAPRLDTASPRSTHLRSSEVLP